MIKEIKKSRLDSLFNKLFITNESIKHLTSGSVIYQGTWLIDGAWDRINIYPNTILRFKEFNVLPIDFIVEKLIETYNHNNLKVIIND